MPLGGQSFISSTVGTYGNPKLKVITTSNPNANTEISQTVTAGKAWEILGCSVALAATVQTPWPSLTITDGTNRYYQSLAGTAALNAGVSAQISWAPGAIALGGAADTVRQGSLPWGLIIPEGHVIATVTTGIGANCDYASMFIYVVEYS